MISRRLVDYVKERYIRLEDKEEEILSFEGFVFGRPCHLILTNRRIIRICNKLGFPQRRRVYLENLKVDSEKSNGDYVRLRLRSSKLCVEIAMYPSFASVIKKKLGAV